MTELYFDELIFISGAKWWHDNNWPLVAFTKPAPYEAWCRWYQIEEKTDGILTQPSHTHTGPSHTYTPLRAWRMWYQEEE